MKSLRILASAAIIASMAATPTFAQPSPAQVTKDVGCLVFGALIGSTTPFLITTDTIDVATSSGNVMLSCHFDIPAGTEPAQAFRSSGFLCGVLGYGPVFAFTTDSFAQGTPGGKALLRCQIKA